jgi:DNA-binding response OmpR family regulator
MTRVLLVEDDDDIREAMAYLLTRFGAEVTTAASGREALTLYEEFKPHAVLLDIRLPDISGVKVLEMINLSDHRSKIFFVSGSPEVLGGCTPAELGAEGFLAKPVDIDRLRNIIKAL